MKDTVRLHGQPWVWLLVNERKHKDKGATCGHPVWGAEGDGGQQEVRISRPMTEAVGAVARSFVPRSCVHRVESLQTQVPTAPPARLLLPVLSASLRPGRERLKRKGVRWRGSGKTPSVCQAPVVDFGSEPPCSPERRGPAWKQDPVELSPCSPTPCPVPRCPAACSPRCRRS